MTGVVLKENRKPFSEDEERQLKVTSRFQQYTQWNLDAAPSVNDKCVRAMQWLDIAKAVSGKTSEASFSTFKIVQSIWGEEGTHMQTESC